LARRHPDRVEGLVIQNGNAYTEGLDHSFFEPVKAFWKQPTLEYTEAVATALTPDGVRWQYTHGTRALDRVSPDTWVMDQALLERPGNRDIQLALFHDYRNNVAEYPKWQAYLRQWQPPTLVVWGANDPIFILDGAFAYKRDLTDVEIHTLHTGHFALEEDVDRIARLMRRFLKTKRAVAGGVMQSVRE
jgi:pimeloyl-ACP methyl ester carboxylesterase